MMLTSELRGFSISIQQQVMVEMFMQFDNEQQTKSQNSDLNKHLGLSIKQEKREGC